MSDEVKWRRDYVDFFLDSFRRTAYESLQKAPDEYDILARCMHLWTDITFPLLREKRYEEIRYFGSRLLTFTFKGLIEAFVMGISGAYLNAFRTLRFIFEMLVQGHYLESSSTGISEKDRLAYILSSLQEIDRKKRSFKSRMIKKLPDVTEKEKEEMQQLYSFLSEYTHPTLKNFHVHTAASFIFNYDALRKIVEAMVRIVDLMIMLAMLEDPMLAKKLDELARNDIEELNMRLSQNRLSKLTKT